MSNDLLTQLKQLHLYGMAERWTEIKAENTGRQRILLPEELLSQLIAAETIDRTARSLKYQLHVAKFPVHRDLISFDWHETPLQQQQIEQLATAHFMSEAHNLILVGGTGTGTTHLATALGVAAIHQEKRVRFYNAVDLVQLLEHEKQQG